MERVERTMFKTYHKTTRSTRAPIIDKVPHLCYTGPGMKILAKLLIIAFLALFLPIRAAATHSEGEALKTANYFLRAGTDLRPEMYERLAAFDLLILPMEAAAYNRDFFEYARSRNPDIIILPYVPSRSINVLHIDDGAQIRKRLKEGIRDEWYLRDSRGSIVSAWPGTLPVNVTTEWNRYLPRFVNDVVLSTGLWDGIFYDEWQDDVSYMNGGNVDLDRNGVPESRAESQRLWQAGNVELLKNTRAIIGERPIIVTNGSSLPIYQKYANGRLFENFPTPWEGSGAWHDTMRGYLWLAGLVADPHILIINGTTKNTGELSDYRAVRYGLTSTLLGNGYFGFDYGDRDHGQIWWYDEYDVRLGKAKTHPIRVNSDSSEIEPGLWRRDFEKGVVFVNSTKKHQEVRLTEDFEKIRGTQDATVNDGRISSAVTLQPEDGIIMLRPLSEIAEKFFPNGSFVRIFQQDGVAKRNGFFAYDQGVRGATLVARIDADRDGARDTIVIDNGSVRTYFNSGGSRSFAPFPERGTGHLSATLSDVNGDGTPELILAPQQSVARTAKKTPTTIRIFSLDGKKIKEILAFGLPFTDGLTVAAGDTDGDGSPEIVAGRVAGSEPIVRVFSLDGRVKSTFHAYDKRFRGGVSIAVGDLNGNGSASIITAPLSAGSPHVRIFASNGRPLNPGFFAFTGSYRGGMMVVAQDIDEDGTDEILALTRNVFTTSGTK